MWKCGQIKRVKINRKPECEEKRLLHLQIWWNFLLIIARFFDDFSKQKRKKSENSIDANHLQNFKWIICYSNMNNSITGITLYELPLKGTNHSKFQTAHTHTSQICFKSQFHLLFRLVLANNFICFIFGKLAIRFHPMKWKLLIYSVLPLSAILLTISVFKRNNSHDRRQKKMLTFQFISFCFLLCIVLLYLV